MSEMDHLGLEISLFHTFPSCSTSIAGAFRVYEDIPMQLPWLCDRCRARNGPFRGVRRGPGTQKSPETCSETARNSPKTPEIPHFEPFWARFLGPLNVQLARAAARRPGPGRARNRRSWPCRRRDRWPPRPRGSRCHRHTGPS